METKHIVIMDLTYGVIIASCFTHNALLTARRREHPVVRLQFGGQYTFRFKSYTNRYTVPRIVLILGESVVRVTGIKGGGSITAKAGEHGGEYLFTVEYPV